MATLLGQLHGTNKNKLAVLKRLREILDVGNGTEYEAILAAGAAVADNVVPMLEAHAVKYLKPAAKVIYLTLRGERGLEEMSDETTHPILGRAAPVAQALVKVLNQELTQGAQANAKLVRFAISALDELTRAHSSVHAVAEAGAIVPCVKLCGSTCTATLECAATILGHLAMNSLLPDGNVRGYWYEVYAAEAVPPLVKLLQHTKSDVVSQAARALRTLVEEAGTDDGDDDDDDGGDALENILGAVRVALTAMQVTETVLGVELLLLQAAVQEAEQKVAQRNQPSQPEAQLEVQLEAPAANPVVVAAIASPAVATVAAAHTAPPVAPAAPVGAGSPHTAVIQLPRARANSHTVASRQKAAKRAAPPLKPPRTKQARHATATSPSQAVPPSIGVAPAAVPTPAEGLHQKMGRVKAELKLDPGLLLVDAIKAANELMGITPAAGTWLPVQVDLLLATIWGG